MKNQPNSITPTPSKIFVIMIIIAIILLAINMRSPIIGFGTGGFGFVHQNHRHDRGNSDDCLCDQFVYRSQNFAKNRTGNHAFYRQCVVGFGNFWASLAVTFCWATHGNGAVIACDFAW